MAILNTKYLTIRCSALLLMVITLLTFLPCPINASSLSSNSQVAVNDNTDFALKLYKMIRTHNGNFCFSPYSISVAFTTVYAGARKQTAEEMKRALCFSLEQSELHPAFAEINSHLKKIQQSHRIQLKIAHSLWPQNGYVFRKEYVDLVKKYYNLFICAAHYKSAAKAARKKINDWVKSKTDNKIRNLIPAHVLDYKTRLVLADAIYFKGGWKYQFKKAAAQDMPFYLDDNKTIDVPMMVQQCTFKYGENKRLKILELPYVNDKLSMLIILPKAQQELSQIEKRLTRYTLKIWTGLLLRQDVKICLPKFKIISSINLKKYLKRMGMKKTFTDTANFSGIDGTLQLFLSVAIHKAFIDVDEHGSKAAAATAITSESRDADQLTFLADHPFLFLIREKDSENILFIGRVENPLKT